MKILINFSLINYISKLYLICNLHQYSNSIKNKNVVINNTLDNNIIISNTTSFKNKKIKNNDFISYCNDDHDCKPMYNCNKNKICEHKNVFPLAFTEFIGYSLSSFLSALAIFSGSGGGLVITGALMYVGNFSTTEAIPITILSVFFTSTYNFSLGLKFKQNNPETDFAEYKSVLVMLPMMLLGSKLGSILNYILPTIITSFIMIIILVYVFTNFYKKYKNVSIIEQKKLLNNYNNLDNNSNILKDKFKETNIHLIEEKYIEMNYIDNTLINHKIIDKINQLDKNDNKTTNIDENKTTLNEIEKEENSSFPLKWVKLILLTLTIYIVDLILEGNKKFKSIINVSFCSKLYFLIFFVFIVCLCLNVKYNRYAIRKQYLYYKSIFPSYYSYRYEVLSSNNEYSILIYSTLAGMLAGVLGVGGGLILSPYMFYLGFSPKTTTSTASLLVIFTSFSSSLMFFMLGTLNIQYSIAIMIPSFIFLTIFNKFINEYIKNSGKQSLLLLILMIVVSISFILTIFSTIYKIDYSFKSKSNLFELNSYCN